MKWLLLVVVLGSSCLSASILPGIDAGQPAEEAGSGPTPETDADADDSIAVDGGGGDDAAAPDDAGTAGPDVPDVGPDLVVARDGDVDELAVPDAGTEVPPARDGGGDATAPPMMPTVGQVVITEIMVDSKAAIAPAGLTSDDVGEWVELLNATDEPLDLFGCALSDMKNTDTIGAHLVVPARRYVTLGRNAPGFAPDYVYATVKFSDQGDRAALSCGGGYIDMVNFATGFPLVQGATLSLSPAHLDAVENDAAASWCNGATPYNTTSKGVDLGTPGRANPACP